MQTLNAFDAGCTSEDRVVAWMLLGSIRAIGDRDSAKQAFSKALSLDRNAVLDPAMANHNAIAALQEAQQELSPDRVAPTALPSRSVGAISLDATCQDSALQILLADNPWLTGRSSPAADPFVPFLLPG